MKIELRKLKLSDVKDFREAINNKEVLKQIDGITYPCTLRKAKDYIKKSLKNKDSFEFSILADNKLVGTIVLENPNKSKKSFEIGYFIAKEYWGQGIATRAVKEILKFAFNKLKLERIWGCTFPENPASGKVLKNAGFKLEGRLRKASYKNRRYYDDLIWGKTR